MSSSLIFLFQNKPGLSEEEFRREILAYENNFIVRNSEANVKSNENLNFTKFIKEEENLHNEKIKIEKLINEDIEICKKTGEENYDNSGENEKIKLDNKIENRNIEDEKMKYIKENSERENNKKINNEFVQISNDEDLILKNNIEINKKKDTKEQINKGIFKKNKFF